VADYFQVKAEPEDVIVRTASNVENALIALNGPENEARKKLIKEK